VAIKPDPHSPATVAAITAQHALQMKLLQGINAAYEGRRMAQALRDTLRAAANHAGDGAAIVNRLAAQLDTIAGVGGGGRAEDAAVRAARRTSRAQRRDVVQPIMHLQITAPTSSAPPQAGASFRDWRSGAVAEGDGADRNQSN
jgi:hypothetical protein